MSLWRVPAPRLPTGELFLLAPNLLLEEKQPMELGDVAVVRVGTGRLVRVKRLSPKTYGVGLYPQHSPLDPVPDPSYFTIVTGWMNVLGTLRQLVTNGADLTRGYQERKRKVFAE